MLQILKMNLSIVVLLQLNPNVTYVSIHINSHIGQRASYLSAHSNL